MTIHIPGQVYIDDYTYTCGAQWQSCVGLTRGGRCLKNLKRLLLAATTYLGGSFEEECICMRSIQCYKPLEKLYQPLCIFLL